MAECKENDMIFSQMMIGVFIGLTSALAASFATNFWVFMFLYSCGFGICNGLAVRIKLKSFKYIIPVYNCWKYFPNNKGLASGIVLAGYGFGAFVFNFVSTAVVNPNNIKPNA